MQVHFPCLWSRIHLFILVLLPLSGVTYDYVFAESANPESEKKVTDVEWGTLRELDLKSGISSPKLKALDGTKVRIPGFIVPLEDNNKSVSEFLLVPSPQACIHVPPPPANQMVHVRMASPSRATMIYGPVWVLGQLKLSETTSPYGKISFDLVGEMVEPYVK